MLRKFKDLSDRLHQFLRMKSPFKAFIFKLNGENFLLRRAQVSDVPELVELERKAYHGRTPWSSFSFYNEIRQRRHHLYLVACGNSQIIALIGARFYLRESHITNIIVAPAYQNHHLGRYLLKYIINRAQDLQSECVSLEVSVQNHPARHLYEQLGFKTTFIRKNYYRFSHTDALNMVLWLKPCSQRRKKLVL